MLNKHTVLFLPHFLRYAVHSDWRSLSPYQPGEREKIAPFLDWELLAQNGDLALVTRD